MVYWYIGYWFIGYWCSGVVVIGVVIYWFTSFSVLFPNYKSRITSHCSRLLVYWLLVYWYIGVLVIGIEVYRRLMEFLNG